MSDYDFTRLNDLRVQAMILDMEVDLETFELVERSDYVKPKWIERYELKRDDSDFNEYFDIDKE